MADFTPPRRAGVNFPQSFVAVWLLATGLALLPQTTLAQQAVSVSGTVAGANGAVEFATLTLHRATDSVVVKTEFSDGQGHFRLLAPGGGRYLLSAAQVGFGRYWSPVLDVAANDLALPTITLVSSAATALKEITVTGHKALYEHQADRTVVNVADNPLSGGATALDVLTRAPGVTMDSGSELGLRGRQGLLVVIDGRRVPLSGSALADYLRALPAEQLQNIELITNPPAQYDAQGGAGVIAISLKKDQRQGTNGNYNLSYGRGEYGKFTTGAGLNHRRKGLNLFGNYAYADRRGFVRLDFDRQYAAAGLLPAANTLLANEQLSHLRSHSGKLGFDLALRKGTQLAAAGSVLASQTDLFTTSAARLFVGQPEPSSRYHSTVRQVVNRPSGSLNLNLRHALADSATAATLAADADYARYRTTRRLTVSTFFDEPTGAPTLLDGDQLSDLSIAAFKVDYSRPMPRRARFEAGLKATRVRTDNDVVFVNTDNGTSTYNAAISNSFRYDENVNAAYLNYRSGPGRSTFQLGLRAEQTNTRAATGDSLRERHYTQLFPSATVQHTLSARHSLGLAMARRVDRPTYRQLNPLRTYLDATSYQAGNRNLVAQTSYNVEVSHTYRQKFVTALAYARTALPIVNVVQPSPDGGRLVVNQDVNLRTEHYYSLTLTAPLDLAKWCSLYANGVFYYARYQGSLANTILDRGRAACTLTLNGSFILSHGWSADVSSLYESGEQYGFEYIRPRGQLAAGVKKTCLQQRGTLSLNAADMLYTTPIRTTSTYNNFVETFYSRQDTRIITAAFAYRFGNGKVAAARKRAAGAEDELRRAGGL